MNTISLADHFTNKKLIRFTLPSIITMFFTSIYGIVNGLAISNLTGKTAFAAINLIIPVTSILAVLGYMFGSGSSALISKSLGEGDDKKANRIFTTIVLVTLILGTALAVLGFAFLPTISTMLGAEGELLEFGLQYGRITLVFTPFVMFEYLFSYLLPTAERPQIGMHFRIISGVTNVVLVLIFVAGFQWGVVGAALANGIGQALGAILPMAYFFSKKNDSRLHFTKPHFDLKEFGKICSNGASEFITNLSVYLVGILFNYQLMKYVGENGIAAFGVVMYINMLFISVFNGYAIGVAPIIGFNNGAGNLDELKNVYKRSIRLVIIVNIVLTIAAMLLARPLSMIFLGYDRTALELTVTAFRIYSISFLFMGLNVFSSAFFTALNNGLISAIISFLRTVVFQTIGIILLPIFMGDIGIWSSVSVAEILAFVVTIICFIKNRSKYRY